MHLEADHVHFIAAVRLPEALVPATLPVPAVVVDEVHAERGPWSGDEGRQLPDDVPGVVCPASMTPRLTASWDSKGRNDGPRGRHVDLEPSTGGLLDRRDHSLAASSWNTRQRTGVCIFSGSGSGVFGPWREPARCTNQRGRPSGRRRSRGDHELNRPSFRMVDPSCACGVERIRAESGASLVRSPHPVK